jgi:hypothetical protein
VNKYFWSERAGRWIKGGYIHPITWYRMKYPTLIWTEAEGLDKCPATAHGLALEEM